MLTPSTLMMWGCACVYCDECDSCVPPYLTPVCVCVHMRAMQAISGQGIDRHLLGLKLIATENGIETPGIFKDVAFSRSLHFKLSTSQVMYKICYPAFHLVSQIRGVLCISPPNHFHTYLGSSSQPPHVPLFWSSSGRWVWCVLQSTWAGNNLHCEFVESLHKYRQPHDG